MCGRTACNLSPEVICRACSYEDPNVESNRRPQNKKPAWRQHPPTKDKKDPQKFWYKRSVNVPPTRFTPVMIRRVPQAEGSSTKTKASDREIMPMMFGMIPFFHKGEAKSHGYRTHNCRLEGVMESKLFRRSWKKRRFCVVLLQGFYKWKEVNEDLPDQPYFVYMTHESTGDSEAKLPMIADNSVWEKSKWSETKGWEGPRIMKLAGMYDVWKHATTGEEIYSYTLFTMKANATLSWLHDRMPVIFRTEDQVQAWLNATEETPDKEVLNILKPATALKWYRVDPKVGNARCQDLDCMCPVQAPTKGSKGTGKRKDSKGSSKKGSKGTGKRKGSKAPKKKGTSKKKGSKACSKKGSKRTGKKKGSKAPKKKGTTKKKGSKAPKKKGTTKKNGSKASSKKRSKCTGKKKGSKATRKRKSSKASSKKGCKKRAKK